MARRRIADQPTSRLAIWARRCAFFALTATILSILIVRSGILEPIPALATFGGALVVAVFGIVLAFGAFIVVWKDGTDGVGHAFAAIGIGVALLGYPAYLGYMAYKLPMINDITTDPIDPPRFDVLARLRPRGTVEYAGLYAAELQRKAYPDIEPLSVSAAPKAAYDVTMAVITRRKWRVVVDRPPQPGRRDGQIEAVARTPIMGFRDDVSIRIRPDDDGSRIDVRSASRYGRHDFGGNASRIRSLLEDVEARADTEEKREQRQQQKPQKPSPVQAGKR
ncbi:DUF1499 domain-containing protein [Rhodoplanes sp. Z2-YC6860]|uniref:DUF1499 domain-containing protein n=1 Tax=Rhodoplanes sp. Z2-YC6860 TaxID=674703 RepID=UPI00078EDF83|nr:DUF1499 domain-containing protein [Rhodoplanes sp. Z2-YC6860]AMN41048.1 hypothetical protein RHPLAN_26100 [Rhodoplanes sp. Z2-YC6860]